MYKDIGFAKLDTERLCRRGYSEAVFCEPKTTEELIKIQEQAKQFFDIANKVKQYLENTNNAAIALDYQKIWEQVSTYIKREQIDLAETELDVENINEIIDELLNLEDEEEYWRIIREIERLM